jgi:predicted ATPase
MHIRSVSVSNFRGIRRLESDVELGDLSFFIGDNGTGKTSLLEALNFCLSPNYVASRLDVNDFTNGGDEPIEILVQFQSPLVAQLPDGFTSQAVECDRVVLRAKKRDRASPGRAFSDLVTTSHNFVPVEPRGEKGWSKTRKNGTSFNFDERQLTPNSIDIDMPRVFYFSRTRTRQLAKGFNSSLSNIVDDLNWRFDRGQRKREDADHFKHHRKSLHDKIFAETDGDTIKKTVEVANSILTKLGVPPVEISVLKTLSPYDNSEVVFAYDGFELPVEQGGSGVEMLVSLSLLEALARLTKDKLIILIDEPELHLHPKFQAKLVEHLTEVSQNIQVVASTHSPLLFKNAFSNPSAKLQVTHRKEGIIQVRDAHDLGFGHLAWSPSWGEICYFAYDLPTAEFHDDLYCSLEDKFRSSPNTRTSQADFDAWLIGQANQPVVQWTDAKGATREETLMTYVRNCIHHPENRHRPKHSEEQLAESISLMCKLARP